MVAPGTLRRALAGAAILFAGLAPVAPSADAASRDPLQAVVVEDSLVGLLGIDPATGNERWRLEDRDGLFGAVATDGLVFASVAAGDGSGTAVYAVPLAGDEPALIDQAPGRAVVAAVAAEGDRLVLLELPLPTPDDWAGPQTGVRDLPLPERWRSAAGPPAARRDNGLGILSADGQRWF